MRHVIVSSLWTLRFWSTVLGTLQVCNACLNTALPEFRYVSRPMRRTLRAGCLFAPLIRGGKAMDIRARRAATPRAIAQHMACFLLPLVGTAALFS